MDTDLATDLANLAEFLGSIEKYLVLSTAHILQADADLLNEHVKNNDGSPPLVLPDREYGWKIPLFEDNLADLSESELGLSPSFMKCVKAAQLVGCNWLHLDRDGRNLENHPLLDHHTW